MNAMENAPMNYLTMPKDADWWRGAVIYQIYPRSFQDSNGDGIGDLRGIMQRLPYVASLGVDAIWISPFYTSPMRDFGYDVSNYKDVDPMFGSVEDFDLLVETAHQLGLKVMIDLVLSHTSDQHPWFQQSRVDRTNEKAGWYVWSDPQPDGTPPNNWLSIFGGSAWTWDPRREQYYLHNFLSCQPDLNLHTLEVQDALLDVTRFWLDRGVDGFRLDTINFYFHDKQLRSNPPLLPAERNSNIAPSVNPYNHQLHLYSKNQPENLEFLKRFRKVLDPHNAAAVGEIGDAQRGLELLGSYTSGGDKVQMSYAFEFLSEAPPTAARFAQVLHEVDEVAREGWACWAFSNHDVRRHATRWHLDARAAKTYATLLLSLRGSVCLYQGEELGLPEASIAFEELQDPYGREFWPSYKGRDGCRTPMVWSDSAPNAGYSQAGKTWLPIDARHLPLAVSAQEAEPGSLLNHYRRALKFRAAHTALCKGAQSRATAQGDLLHFERSDDRERLVCVFNLSDQPAHCALPDGAWQVISKDLCDADLDRDGMAALGPWDFLIARLHDTREEI